ncbi:helix-turn-helix transcriptional regulator [Muricauda sp. CAU 1633]|uniref:helix-turn-helix domain-containing protein n=1 Tax=Allomuricauda sp. CAU 1633 TaxID=2816036 RepID=UPI001A8D13EC|nr:AraC family transcriptional regulator [Muricauda sp. CAU 1633]MBO0324131.1 helix-turn-helix transcriptional regulator [Muricauda sp. CAU 1633]
MNDQNVYTLINQQNGNLAFKIFSFNNNSHFDNLQRNNYYSIIWVKQGEGLLKVDFSEYQFTDNTLFAFSAYQPFMFSTHGKISGVAIQFHSDFYCIYQNPADAKFTTALFNNIYEAPCFGINQETGKRFDFLINELKHEFSNQENQEYELLVPILKILLINASRIKDKSNQTSTKIVDSSVPYILHNLKIKIEHHFKKKHSASQYASLLNISPNSLSKLVKSHFNKTLTELIVERIIIEAKRELYMTNKTIKEIAWSLGYNDEYYFSRLFKKSTEVSPQLYRNSVGFGKAELN